MQAYIIWKITPSLGSRTTSFRGNGTTIHVPRNCGQPRSRPGGQRRAVHEKMQVADSRRCPEPRDWYSSYAQHERHKNESVATFSLRPRVEKKE